LAKSFKGQLFDSRCLYCLRKRTHNESLIAKIADVNEYIHYQRLLLVYNF